MGTLTRLFVAADPGDEARHALAAVLGATFPDLPGAVVAPANWHVTLRFVGPTSDDQADRLRYTLHEADTSGPFQARLGGLGAFPRASRAAVLWVGLTRGEEEMAVLAAEIEERVQEAGFEPEERPFRGHITLSRLRPTVDVRPIVDREFDAGVSFSVEEFVLFASILGRGGARYEVIDRFPL